MRKVEDEVIMTSDVSALEAVRLVLESCDHVQGFENQIKLIHEFTTDVLMGEDSQFVTVKEGLLFDEGSDGQPIH